MLFLPFKYCLCRIASKSPFYCTSNSPQTAQLKAGQCVSPILPEKRLHREAQRLTRRTPESSSVKSVALQPDKAAFGVGKTVFLLDAVHGIEHFALPKLSGSNGSPISISSSISTEGAYFLSGMEKDIFLYIRPHAEFFFTVVTEKPTSSAEVRDGYKAPRSFSFCYI